MPEPDLIRDLLLATVSGGMVVLFGALYALLFAHARLYNRPALMRPAYMSYFVLCAAVAVLIISLNFQGFWLLVAAVMLVGYLLAPHAIWRLCVATHDDSETENITENQGD